jgi:hypothetical protein
MYWRRPSGISLEKREPEKDRTAPRDDMEHEEGNDRCKCAAGELAKVPQ